MSRLLSAECPRCHKTIIHSVLAEARGDPTQTCRRCRFKQNWSKRVIKMVLGLDDQKLKQFSSNQLYERSTIAAIKGVAVFGLSRPQPTFPPIAVVWNLTHRCNLRCIHCYQDSKNERDQGNHPNELSPSEAIKTVDILAEAGCGSLSFSGGEPLLREDFYDLAGHTAKRGLLCTVSTNGTMIDSTVANDLDASGVTGVSISLDSFNSRFHDEFRGVAGSHAKALKGLEACSELGKFKELILATTLTNRNMEDIPKLMELASELGISRFYVSRILPVGRGKKIQHLDVTQDQKKQVLKELAEKFVAHSNGEENLAVMTRGMTYFAPQCARLSDYEMFPISEIVTGFEQRHVEILGEARKLFKRFAEYAGGCATGLTYCGLSPEGEILPCAPASDMHLGNILSDGLERVWLDHPVLQMVRNRSKVEGKCGKCEDRLICGGCRVTAYGETGNWLASDPSCPY